MNEKSKFYDWVDPYIRGELSDEELAIFEERLIADSQLQKEFEAVFGIKQALKLDAKTESNSTRQAEMRPGRNQWSSLAIAASVLLAVTSTTLYWRTSVEAGRLKEQLSALQAPRSTVLNVPINIMRSAGGVTPDVIVQKPAGNGAIVLDIELSQRFQELDLIEFQLLADESESVLNWTATADFSGRVSVVLNSELVPEGMVQLVISDPSSKLQDSRLLEFRKPRP